MHKFIRSEKYENRIVSKEILDGLYRAIYSTRQFNTIEFEDYILKSHIYTNKYQHILFSFLKFKS